MQPVTAGVTGFPFSFTLVDAVNSEDMSSEQDYGGIRAINPFVDDSKVLLAK